MVLLVIVAGGRSSLEVALYDCACRYVPRIRTHKRNSAERPPKRAVPFVSDFLDRITLGKTKHGPKVALYNCLSVTEAAGHMVRQHVEEHGKTLSAAVYQVLCMKMEPNYFWPDLDRQWSILDRDKLYDYCSGKTGHGWRKKKQMEELKNPPRFVSGDGAALT